jgi:hypothetical protein
MYQTSNDGVTVLNTYDLGNARTTNGTTTGTLVDITANIDGALFVRFGARCRNNTGSTQDLCQASIRVDLR